jgi:hypothetical protein
MPESVPVDRQKQLTGILVLRIRIRNETDVGPKNTASTVWRNLGDYTYTADWDHL